MKFISNPVLVKELRGRIRGNRAMILLTVYLGLTGVVTLLIYLAYTSSVSNGPADFDAGRTIGKAIFLTVMTAALVQVCIITPSLTAGSIAGEKERETYDLLITTMLSPFQIAVGKLAAALAFALLLIIAVLPLAALSFLFGGVSGLELVLGIIGLVVTAVLYATVGLFWSTVMRTTLAATVMAQGTIILSLLGITFLFVIVSALIGGTPDNALVPFYVYGLGSLLCLHPFIALGLTATLLGQGESPFVFTLPIANQDLLLPSPWLVYTVFAAVLTVILTLLVVRSLKPVETAPPKKSATRTRGGTTA